MPVSANQLKFCDVSTDFDKFYNQNQDDLLSLLNQFIDISDFIPFSFYQKYYSKFGTKRDFTLESMLNAFIIKNILSIPSIDLLITFYDSDNNLDQDLRPQEVKDSFDAKSLIPSLETFF